ncbi:site-2 protease family protein [Chitinophaga sp. CF418]|uniref:site-2 protease family protein n=1 Tax=Chitinophaga sp. CF418 TaxID=1855287 RepID=UPI00091CC757|nr:site-2 protease family protein [Chitinophaga sp. CF418]SHN28490.1 Zn-dependent protease (includes SpoIVFB) [Chitinophaga sp. CF418]
MKATFTLFTLKGTKIGIHWTFILLISWILIADGLTGRTPAESLWKLVAVMAAFISVVLHELGHMFAARYFGIPAKEILLLPIGGMTQLKRQPETPGQEIMISLSGPLVNLSIAFLLIPFLAGHAPLWRSIPFFISIDRLNLIFFLHAINVLLGVINLIPAFPMDGGRVLRGMMELFTTPLNATNIAIWVGRFISSLFVISGLLNMNLLLVIAGVVLLLQGTMEKHNALVRDALKNVTLRDILVTDYRTISSSLTLREALPFLTDYRQPYFVITAGTYPVGIISRGTLIRSLDKKHIDDPVADLITEEHPSFDIGITALSAWENLPPETDMIIPVTSNGALVGVISRDAIIEYLALHKHSNAIQEVFS